MKKILLASSMLLLSIVASSQDFKVPTDFEPKKAEDYKQYEQEVIDGFNWLMEIPVKNQPRKRKEANAFLLKWMTGSPTVHIEIQPEIVTFMTDSPDLLMMFMAGWTKYSIETGDENNKMKGTMAGLESVMTFYKKNKPSFGKIKSVEKYLKMKDKGKLEEYVKENI